MNILSLVLLTLLSVLLISKGSDWLTDSLVPIAAKLKTSSIAVGLILVSVVVSLPEILVAVDTALRGHQTISFGVIFGSVITNIGLMTGLSALVSPLSVSKTMILRDGIFSIVVPILIFAISAGGTITRLDGLAIFLLFIPYLINIFLQEKRAGVVDESKLKRNITVELELIGLDFGHLQAGWTSFTVGLVLLLGGTYLLSYLLVVLVEQFTFDSLLVGMTVGALIPSLPNIAASYKATKLGLTEVAVSETIGSNVFTLLVTVGIMSMIAPIKMEPQWLTFDIPVIIAMSMVLFIYMISGRGISRKEGVALILSYLAILLMQVIIQT